MSRSQDEKPKIGMSELFILEICWEYIRAGWHVPFTYDSLTAFIKTRRLGEYRQQTLEKYLRNLARAGFFDREYRRNPRGNGYVVYYYPTDEFYSYFKSRGGASERRKRQFT